MLGGVQKSCHSHGRCVSRPFPQLLRAMLDVFFKWLHGEGLPPPFPSDWPVVIAQTPYTALR